MAKPLSRSPQPKAPAAVTGMPHADFTAKPDAAVSSLEDTRPTPQPHDTLAATVIGATSSAGGDGGLLESGTRLGDFMATSSNSTHEALPTSQQTDFLSPPRTGSVQATLPGVCDNRRTLCSSQSTCWTLIDVAAGGGLRAREEFAHRYSGPVRAYLAQRWRGSAFVSLLDDAVQEVFAACFREDGPLARADRSRSGFRAFLYGTVRNIARAMERRHLGQRDRPTGRAADFNEFAVPEDTLSQVFDQAWARTIVREAAVRQRGLAARAGEAALRRVELLHLRFYENLPIRAIAKLWQVNAAHLHREYAKARDEFRTALCEVVRDHDPDPVVALEARVEELLAAFGK